MPGEAAERLICPTCGTGQPPDERFCPTCNVPLVRADSEPQPVISERHQRARKVKPQLAEGRLIRVAGARNQAEAEFIQGLLLEEGVPSVLRRTAGFDVPDFLAAGPRDVLVPESGAQLARELLREVAVAETVEPEAPHDARLQTRIVLAVLAGGFLAALIAWLLVNAGS